MRNCEHLTEKPMNQSTSSTEYKSPQELSLKKLVKKAIPDCQMRIKDSSQVHPSAKDGDDYRLFDEICKTYLTTGTCRGKNCFLKHELPSSHQVQETIKNLKEDKFVELYEGFLLTFSGLFKDYFKFFVKKAGNLKMRSRLHKMLLDCEARKMVNFWEFVVEGLELSGLTRFQALEFILECNTARTPEAIDVILHLIIMPPSPLETIVVMIEKIQEFVAFPGFLVKEELLNRLIYLAEKYENISLILFLLKYFKEHNNYAGLSEKIINFLQRFDGYKDLKILQQQIQEFRTTNQKIRSELEDVATELNTACKSFEFAKEAGYSFDERN